MTINIALATSEAVIIGCDSVASTSRYFLDPIRMDWEKGADGKYLKDPSGELRDGPEFLVGGHGRDDDLPSIFRIRVAENTVLHEFGVGGNVGKAGVAWNGQADAVERFLRGYDGIVRHNIERAIGATLGGHSQAVKEYVAATINVILDKLKQKMPLDVKVEIPELKNIKVDWDDHEVSIDYSNMPLQEAINFVAFLVLLQEGKSRFARGVGTVGGRTHVGVIMKGRDFELLDEPKLTHRYTGFGDDK